MAATLWKDFKTVKVEKENGITWCILNRPEKRNAMTPQLHYDMDILGYDRATIDSWRNEEVLT